MPTTAIVTLTDVKAEINETSAVNDTELTGFINAVTRVIEERVGPVITGQVTEAHDGGGQVIVLSRAPLVSVDSVVEYNVSTGVTLTEQELGVATVFDGYGFTADLDAGLIRRTTSGTVTSFCAGSRNVVVTYTYGRASVPGNIRMAALELIRYRWAPQRSAGPSTLGGQPAPQGGQVVQGIYFPQSVLEMLGPDARAPRVG